MEDNLHEKPRKELKQLCSQFNIRTAGVKHDELVRLLRNKLYPAVPETPRSPKARGQNSTKANGAGESTSSENGDSYRTPKKSASLGRSLRTLSHENESPRDAWKPKAFQPESGVLRKPLLTKSNTTPVKRSEYVRKKVYPGVYTPAQENAYVTQGSLRRLCQINASPLANKNKAMASKNGEQSPAASPIQPPAITPFIPEANASANMSELGPAAGSPRGSEGEASRAAIEPISDVGSENLGSPRVSEAEVMSESDDFRSVGESHSQSRFGSHPKDIHNRASSRLSLYSVASALSFATAGSWERELEELKGFEHDLSEAGGHETGQSIDQYIAAAKARHRHHKHHSPTEHLFPDSFEGTDFLVGGADATDLSFLEAGAADPEEIAGAHHDEGQLDNDKSVKPLETLMGHDYVNDNRGSGDTGEEQLHSTSGDVAVADITEDRGDDIGDIQITPAAVSSKEDITSSQEFPPVGDGISPEAPEDYIDKNVSPTEGLRHGHGSEDEAAAISLHPPSDGDVEEVPNTTGTTHTKDANDLADDSLRGGDDNIIAGPSSEAQKEAVDDMVQHGLSSSNVPSHLVENGRPEASSSPPHEHSANADTSVDQGQTMQEMGSNQTSEEAAAITGSVEGALGEVVTPESGPVPIPESVASPYDVSEAVKDPVTSIRDAAEVGTKGGEREVATDSGNVKEVEEGNCKGVAEETDDASASEAHGPSSEDAEISSVEVDTAPQSRVESNGADSPESDYGEPSSQLSEDSEGLKDVDTVEGEDQVSRRLNTEEGEASTSRSPEDQRQMDAALLGFTMGGSTEAPCVTNVKGQGAEDSQDLEMLPGKINSVQAVNCSSNGDIQISPPSRDTEDNKPGKDVSSSSRQSNGDLRSEKPAKDKGAVSTKKTVAFALEPVSRKIDEKDENHVGGRYPRPGRAQDLHDKDDLELRVTFPLSVVLWCSELCSSLFRHARDSARY